VLIDHINKMRPHIGLNITLFLPKLSGFLLFNPNRGGF
jgi:hypothetical protein